MKTSRRLKSPKKEVSHKCRDLLIFSKFLIQFYFPANPETRFKSWIKKFSRRKVCENKFAKKHPRTGYRIFSDPRGQNYKMEFWEALEGLNYNAS